MSQTNNSAAVSTKDVKLSEDEDKGNSVLPQKYSPKKIRYQLNVQFGPLGRWSMVSAFYTLFWCGIVAVLSSLFGGFSPLVWGFAYSLPAGFYCFMVIIVVKIWHFVGKFTYVERNKKKKADEILDPNQWPQVIQTVLTFLFSYLFQGVAVFFLSLPLFVSPLTALAGFCMWIPVVFYLLAFARFEKYPRITGIYNPNQQ